MDALVVAVQHCDLQQTNFCSILCSSRTLRLAILTSCSGCLKVSLDLKSLQQLLEFAAWLSEHGHTIRSISLSLALNASIPYAALEDALLLCLSSSRNQQRSLLHLSTFGSSFSCGPRVLEALPCNSLTSLALLPEVLRWPPPPHPFCLNALGSALGALRNLQDLQLHIPTKGADNESCQGVFQGLAQLSSLTRLDLSILHEGTLGHTGHLPSSLLKLLLHTAQHGQQKPVKLQHLTAVTSLSLATHLPPSSTLPPRLRHLKAWDAAAEAVSAVLTPLQHISSLDLTCKEEGTRALPLTSLTSLTSLTHLELTVSYKALAAAAPPVWLHIPYLRSLTLTEQVAIAADIFTPAMLHNLSSATTLSRLVITWQTGRRACPAKDVQELCAHVADLKQLQELQIDSYPVGVTACLLSQLTKLTHLELPLCELSDSAVVALAGGLKGLAKLNLADNSDLSDACAPAIAQLTRLTELRLECVESKLTDEGLKQLSSLRKLQKLGVARKLRGSTRWAMGSYQAVGSEVACLVVVLSGHFTPVTFRGRERRIVGAHVLVLKAGGDLHHVESWRFWKSCLLFVLLY